MSTYIHGIGASENIDSSGERLSILGMDISSLDKDGVFTYEHELAKVTGPDGKPTDVSIKIPSQVVGKILKAKKIFSDKDAEDDHQLYFWNKCKTPYLYVMGELFDDYTEAARDLAGKFRYDADRKGQNERTVMNFSVEGGKISKNGIDVDRSVARKITITVMPCNKAAVAEMVQSSAKSKNDLNELFKTETVEIEVLDFKKDETALSYGASTALSGAGPTSAPMANSEKLNKTAVVSAPSLNRSKKLFTTTSGKDYYGRGTDYTNFAHQDHAEVADYHRQQWKSSNKIGDQDYHSQKIAMHNKMSANLKAKSIASPRQPEVAKPHGSVPSQSGPKVLGNKPNKLMTLSRSEEQINKALDAGSALAAPNALTQGAALGKEELMGKTQNVAKPKGPTFKASPGMKIMDSTPKAWSPKKLPAGTPVANPSKPIRKSEWLLRAENEYANWTKREQFEKFMKSRMPHLTKGEIQAIGQAMVLSKSLGMEEALVKIAPSEFQHSYVIKKEKK